MNEKSCLSTWRSLTTRSVTSNTDRQTGTSRQLSWVRLVIPHFNTRGPWIRCTRWFVVKVFPLMIQQRKNNNNKNNRIRMRETDGWQKCHFCGTGSPKMHRNGGMCIEDSCDVIVVILIKISCLMYFFHFIKGCSADFSFCQIGVWWKVLFVFLKESQVFFKSLKIRFCG